MNKATLAIFLFLSAPIMVPAATVYKCIDENGKTEFSQTPCNADAERIDVKNPRGNIGISSKRKSAQKEISDILETKRKSREKKAEETAKKTGCHPLQSYKLRRLIIEKKLAKCMTKEHVRKVFDRGPTRINYGSNGEESWYYRLSRRSRTYVHFDSRGLVKSWSGSR